MKKSIVTFLLMLSGALFVWAQDGATTLAYSIAGKVKYAPAGSAKFKKLAPGMALTQDGMLKLYGTAEVGIFYDGEYAVISSPGEQSVKAITDNYAQFSESNVCEAFGLAVEGSIHPYFRSVATRRSGFTEGSLEPTAPPPKKGKDGAGNKNYKIIRLQPFGGKVANPQPTFKWKLDTPNKKVKHFKFILSSDAGEVLLEKDVKGYAYTLATSDYRLQAGQYYKWKVTAADNPELSTPNVTFQFVSDAELNEKLQELTGSKMYQQGDAAAKLLLEASWMERYEFFARANERYETAASQHKRNPLANMMYQAFLWQYDMVN